ncbi:MAG TPA: NAD-dependent epimerase/dehydratase family protein [Bryobacteraceae bacterium]|nr:NAD-dependent epimerase/dehydratase family protein [Bryobacteraceae bacterium]
MKVMIIGGTGFISGQIAEKAAAAGHEVVLFNRGLRNPHASYDVVNGDANKLSAFKEELLALKPDVVVHSMALTEQHAKELVSVFEGTKTQLIALSSADCYEALRAVNRGEDRADFPIREDAELSSTKHYYKSMGGGDYDKNLMTAVLMDAFKEGKVSPTVFRLPMVYGPGDHQYANRHGEIIRHIVDKQADLVMNTADQSSLFTYGYVENIAAAVVHSFGLPQTIGQIYNLGEPDVRTKRRWADLYAENAGHHFTYHILPPEAVGGGFAEAPQNFIMDTSKFRNDTGFTEPVSLDEAIKRTYDWAIQHPECLKDVPVNYPAEQAIAQLYEQHMAAFRRKIANPPGPGPQ